MARLARLFAAGLPVIAVQRVIAGELLTRNDGDAELLMRALIASAQQHRLELHAFAVLPEELQLLATAQDAKALSETIQSIGRSYVAGFNARHQRRGALWGGRFRSSVIEPEKWLLNAMAAIENGPRRLGLVADAAHYPWSSYRQHIGLSGDLPLTDHREYWRLGNTPFERQRVYLARSLDALEPALEAELWRAVDGGWALGSADFAARLADAGARRALPMPRGRRKRMAT